MKQLPVIASDLSKDLSKEFAQFKITAAVRPSFEPDFQRYKSDISTEVKEGKRVKAVMPTGTFFDVLFSPAIPQDVRKKATLAKMQKSIRSLRSKNSGERSKKGRPPTHYEVSALYEFNNVFSKFVQTALDKSIPNDFRVKTEKEDDIYIESEKKSKKDEDKASKDFGKNVKQETSIKGTKPADFYTYFSKHFKGEFIKSFPRSESKVIIADNGESWRISLPLGIYSLDSLLTKSLDDNAVITERLKIYKDFGTFMKRAGFNILSSGRLDTVVPYDKIKSVIPNKVFVDIPQLKDFIKDYVVGFRIVVKPVAGKTFDRVFMGQKEVESPTSGGKTGGSGKFGDIDIVDETVNVNPKIDVEEIKKITNEVDVSELEADYENAAKYDAIIRRDMTAYLVVDLPKAEAEYYCQTPASQIRPSDLLEYFRTLYTNKLYPIVPYFYPLETVEKKNAGFQARPKINNEGLCIDKSNNIYYIPTVNNIKLFNELNDALSARTNGEFSFDIENLEDNFVVDQEKFPSNRLIYTDWVNNKFAYSDQEGRLRILDTEDLRSVKPYALLRVLNSTFTSFDKFGAISVCDFYAKRIEFAFGLQFITYVDAFLKTNKYSPESDSANYHALRYLQNKAGGVNATMSKYVDAAGKCVAFLHAVEDGKTVDEAFELIFNGSMDTDDISQAYVNSVSFADVLNSEFGKPLLKYISDSIPKVLENVELFIQKCASDPIWALRIFARLFIIYHYAPKKEEVILADREDRKTYITVDPKEGVKGFQPAFKNVGDGKQMKHYQNRALSVLNESPQFSILAIDAGGGKTILVVANIIQEIEKGKVHKPLVLCPSHLVKDYVGEINYFTEGKFNGVVLTNFTFENYGQGQLRELVQNSPPNTIFIADYDMFRLEPKVRSYSNEMVDDYRYLNFFREAEFDGVWMDESHYLKNNSQRYRSVMFAIAEIPLKRLATGTITPNRLKDIIRQFSFFDPSVFGSEGQWKAEIEAATPGTIPSKIMNLLTSHCSFIYVKRREWAAELPDRVQTFTPVAKLTKRQRIAYEILCAKTQKEIENVMSKFKDAEGIFGGKEESSSDNSDESDDFEDNTKPGNDSDVDDDAEETNDEKEEKLFGALQRNIAHIEMFLSAPTAHKLAMKLGILKSKEDKRSPKADVIEHHFREHVNQKIPGKVLVFTNWQVSVHHIYNDMAPDIRAVTMKYFAKDKVKLINEFKNSNKVMMIGIGRSMNTGLNLQFCSRLIFCETVWTPGELEQSLARVFRPVKVGMKDDRKKIYINHVVVDGTIDVVKTAKLISKWVTVTKTLNYDNPLYDKIPDVEEIPLKIKDLMTSQPSFYDELQTHAEAFRELLTAETLDFAEFRKNNPDKLGYIPVKDTGLIEGSKLLSKVPYVPGMTLLNQKDLGLVPYNEYKSSILAETGEFNLKKMRENNVPVMVHTEYGDGIAVSEGNARSQKRGVQFDTDEDLEDNDVANNDFGDKSILEDDDGERDLTEEDIKKITESIKDQDISDVTDTSTSELEIDFGENIGAKKMVKVEFNINTAEFDPDIMDAIKKYKDQIERRGTHFYLSFDPDTVFVITDKTYSTKDLRTEILNQVEGITEVQETDLVYNPEKKSGTEEAVRERILNDAKKFLEKDGSRKRKNRMEEEKQRKIDKRVDEEKRGRGRPPKPIVEEEQPEKRGRGRPRKTNDVVPSADTEKNGAIEMFISQNDDVLMLSASTNDPDIDINDLNEVMSVSSFIDIPPYLAISIPNARLLEKLLDEIAPQFEDGVEITIDTPVITQKVIDRLKLVTLRGRGGVTYEDPKTGERYPVEIVDNGWYVHSKDELPKVSLTEDSREIVNDLYDEIKENFTGKIVIERTTTMKLLAMNNKFIRKKMVPAGYLRVFPVNIRRKLYLCADIATNPKASLTVLKQAATSAGLKFQIEENDLFAFYSSKSDLLTDIKQIMEHYEIENLEDLKQDSRNIVSRGRPSSGLD